MTVVCKVFVSSSLQAFTGTPPFGGKRDSAVVVEIIQNKRPERPPHPDVSGELWKLIQRCWDKNPALRPEASEVRRILFNSLVPHPFWRSSIVKPDGFLDLPIPPPGDS